MATAKAYVHEVGLAKTDNPVVVRLPNDDAVEVHTNGRVIYYSDKGETVYTDLQMGPRGSRRSKP